MRKLLIKLFALSYFIKVGKRYINFPRILPFAFFSFSLGVLMNTENDLSLLFFLPFVIGNFIALGYFRSKPLTKDDLHKGYLGIGQAAQWSYLEYIMNHKNDFKHIYEVSQKRFLEKFGDSTGQKFSTLGTMIPLYCLMALLGYLYYLKMS